MNPLRIPSAACGSSAAAKIALPAARNWWSPSRAVVVAAAAALVLASAAGIAGCSSDGAQSGAESIPDSSDLPDSGQTEAGPDSANDVVADAGSDAPYPDCGTIPPTGNQLVASTAPLVLQGGGLTSDGYAFYEDTNTQILYAVGSAGGSPVSLGTMKSQGGTFYRNGGKAALFLPAPADPMTGVATLNAWSKASGQTTISTGILGFDAYNYNYDVTQDGAYVAFFSRGPTGTALTVATIDGATQRVLVPGIDLSNPYCMPFAQFVGNTIVAYYCLSTAVPDSGIPAGAMTVASFPVTSSNFGTITQTTIVNLSAPSASAPMWNPFPVSPDGTKLLIATTGGLGLYPTAGGAPTTIDTAGGGGAFTPSGDVVYGTTGGALKRWSAAADAGAPMTLDSSGVNYLLSISPDGNWTQIAQNVDPTGSRVDIWLASATPAGSLTQVWNQTTALPIGFSVDSKYETFATNVPTTFGITTFDLYASPVSGGAPLKLLTTAGMLAFTTGSKLVVNTNADKATGSADIMGLDLASPSAATTLVAHADPHFFYASGPNTVVYTWYCAPTSKAVLWTVSAP